MLLNTQHLTHIYGVGTPFEKAAIEDISVDIGENEFIGIIGRTGSGKSTFIQHLNGIIKPTSGTITYRGEDCWAKGFSRTKLRFEIGLVFQYPEYQLFEETVGKDIAFGPKNMGLSEEETDERITKALHFVGMNDSYRDRSPFELSGGQKRRVAIAGIMAMEPKVLILDEPTAGLDPRGRDEILARIREYRQERRSTVVLVSHNMEDIAKNCEKVLVMNDARLEMFASVTEVFEHSQRLREIGLNVPQITRIFLSLRQKGYDVPQSVYTVEQACAEIVKLRADI